MKPSIPRREFLARSGQTAAVTAAIAALGGVHSETARAEETVRLGIIGCLELR